LKPVDGASVQQDEMCLENTRVEIIDEISAWINSIGDEVPQVFWLCGQAGTGKSAISHTIGQRFKALSRLGAFFSFNRTYSAERTPHKALHTLAHNLAYVDQAFQNALVKVLDKDVTIAGTTAIQVQWDNLIVQPAQSLADNRNGPIVIIIDAFDECGDKSSKGRKALLSVLTRSTHGLPKNFHILITSRPEPDVLHALSLQNSPALRHKDMIDIPNTEDDILKYIQYKMMDPNEIWGVLSETECFDLAKMSEGFFQWAFTACEALKGWGKGGSTVSELFEDLRAVSPKSQNDLQALDGIYRTILEIAFDFNNPRAMKNYRLVMSQLLAGMEPVSQKMLARTRHEYLDVENDGAVNVVIPFLL